MKRNVTTIKFTTIKEIRKAMRAMNQFDYLLIEGFGQITKIGKLYACGPLPEDDDSDVITGYSAWCYCQRESWIIDDIKKFFNVAA
jgi:hypothetical protein